MCRCISLCLFIIANLAIGGCAESNADELDMQRETVKQIFIGPEEPKVKDAIWTQKGVFKVGVIDDGTNRSGYANYVCEVLYEHGFKGKKVWVQVLDVVKLARDGDWVKLGEARCQ